MSTDVTGGLPELFDRGRAPTSEAGVLPRAYAWAETEIREWLAEADDEAAAVIDRARAEAIRLELAGYQELERLREEAVRVRMSTAERVARRLSEARSQADQVLATAAGEAEGIMESARRVVLDLLSEVEAVRAAMTESGARGPGLEALSGAASRLQALLAPAVEAAPSGYAITDQVVMDDRDPWPERPAPLPAAPPRLSARVPARPPVPTRPPEPPDLPLEARVARLESRAARRPGATPPPLPDELRALPAVRYFPDDVASDRARRRRWRARLARMVMGPD